jgi:hypothetical protein
VSADPIAPEGAAATPQVAPVETSLTPPPPPSPTIHEATVAQGFSGTVQYGAEIDEATAVKRRASGLDIIVRGDDTAANRRLARKIEAQVGTPSLPQPPHMRAGPRALPHFHQQSRNPGGHGFYETDKRKARKKP